MTSTRTLLLMRHAQAQDFAPGLSDDARPLTEVGHRQAAAAGAHLREQGTDVDFVLCSAATRTQQTLAAMDLPARVQTTWAVYNAGSDAIAQEIREAVPAEASVVLVIGHAPGIPALAHDLADQDSDQQALTSIRHRFPTGTIVELTTDAAWADLDRATVRSVRPGGH